MGRLIIDDSLPICRDCAKGNGARGGEDAWTHSGLCPFCGEVRLLTPQAAWGWRTTERH